MLVFVRSHEGHSFLLSRLPGARTHLPLPTLQDCSPSLPSTWSQVWDAFKLEENAPTSDSERLKKLQIALDQGKLHLSPSNPARYGGSINLGALKGYGAAANDRASEPVILGPGRGDQPVLPPPTVVDLPDLESDAPATVSEHAHSGAQPVAETETRGCPISMVSGEELLSLEEAQLPGPMPLVWKRTYRSAHCRDSGLGCGWTHSASDKLTVGDQHIDFHDDEGRTLRFQRPELDQCSRYVPESFELRANKDGTYVLTQGDAWHKVFRPLGQGSGHFVLHELRHPQQAFHIRCHYSAKNSLQRLSGNWGKEWRFERDEHDRIRRLLLINTQTRASKTLLEYDYNDRGDLVAQRNAKGVGESYRYAHHLLVQRTLNTGFNYYYEWDRQDPQARCTRTWGDQGIYDYRFTWDPENNTSTATDSRGYRTTFVCNDYGQITHETDPEGGVHRYTYERGKKTSYTDPNGHTTEYFHNAEGRFSGSRDALDRREIFSYFRGKLTTYKDKHRAVWRYHYNRQGLLTQMKDPEGLLTTYHYNEQGLISCIQTPQHGSTHYRWSEHAELIAVTDPMGHTRECHYNEWGELVALALKPKGQTLAGMTRYHYSPSGQLEQVIAANGQRSTYTYNAHDQLTRFSDPKGRLVQFEYDGLSQVTRRIDPVGNSLNYEYDQERNLTALINEKGERHTFVYDGNERLIKEIGFDGRTQHYKYNPGGQLIKHMDAGQVLTEFERDPLGQMLTRSSRDLRRPQKQTRSRYAYNAKGQLSEAYNAHHYIAFEHDIYGNVVSEHRSDLDDKKQRIPNSDVDILSAYSGPTQLAQQTLPDGQQIHYHYSPLGHLQSVARNGQLLTEITRDDFGRERSRTQGTLIQNSDYDPMGRLQKQWVSRQDQKGPTPIQREYHYNDFGQLSRLNDGPKEIHYIYDFLDRLECTEGDIEEQFHFDPASNLVALNTTTSSSPGNRLAFHGDRHFDYDARGNLIREKRGKNGQLETRYHYNLHNQLEKVEQHTQCIHYTYDPLGRRIQKRDAFGCTHYLWAGDQLVQEQREQLKKTYIYEPNSFKPLALVQDDEVYHYHLDHLGTPRELTKEDGTLAWQAQYSAYGNVVKQVEEKIENNLRFQGQYYDKETGLHYNRHRYYNPTTGQFTTQDPIGLLGGVNNYQYAPNPISWVDPLGLTCKEQKYNSAPLLTDYEGEHDPNNLNRWNCFFGDDVVCQYLDENQRKPFEVTVQDGLLAYKNGPNKGKLVDTRNMSSLHSSTPSAIFVMDPHGSIYLGSHGQPGSFHHSSFLAGGNVSSAGEMIVHDGKIVEISNSSGHYKPKQSLNDQVFTELENKGMSKNDVGNITRSGVDDSGKPMIPKKQGRVEEANNWKPGDQIPYDWDEF